MNEPITGVETHWRYYKPPNTESKVLLLTTGKVAIVGPWKSGIGVIGWCPLPKRNKEREEEIEACLKKEWPTSSTKPAEGWMRKSLQVLMKLVKLWR